MKYIKLFENFSMILKPDKRSVEELEDMCTNTLAYLLDDTDYNLKILTIDSTQHKYKIKLTCDKIINSYNINHEYKKNSGPSWSDIKDYYIPLTVLLEDNIYTIADVPSIEIIYKTQYIDEIKNNIITVPINRLEKFNIEDIWYINLYVKL